MIYGKPKRLVEITNTPKSRKIALEEPEHAIVVDDSDIIELHLGISEADEESLEGVCSSTEDYIGLQVCEEESEQYSRSHSTE